MKIVKGTFADTNVSIVNDIFHDSLGEIFK
jgi:hypothetical protein